MYQVTAITNDEQLKGIPYIFPSLIMYISYLWSDYEDSSWDIQAGIEDIEAFTNGRIFFPNNRTYTPGMPQGCNIISCCNYNGTFRDVQLWYSIEISVIFIKDNSIYVFKSMLSNHSNHSTLLSVNYCRLLAQAVWHIGSCQNRRYSTCVSCVTQQLNNYSTISRQLIDTR